MTRVSGFMNSSTGVPIVTITVGTLAMLSADELNDRRLASRHLVQERLRVGLGERHHAILDPLEHLPVEIVDADRMPLAGQHQRQRQTDVTGSPHDADAGTAPRSSAATTIGGRRQTG